MAAMSGKTFVTDSKTSAAGAGDSRGDAVTAQPLDAILASLRGLRFGSVNIIVQDGVVIQIDRTEKCRLRTNRHDRGA